MRLLDPNTFALLLLNMIAHASSVNELVKYRLILMDARMPPEWDSILHFTINRMYDELLMRKGYSL